MPKADAKTEPASDAGLVDPKGGEVEETKPTPKDVPVLKAELAAVEVQLTELNAQRKELRAALKEIEPLPEPAPVTRPAFPHKEEDDRGQFFLVWSPYNQYLPANVFDTRAEAETVAQDKAESNPGTDWYVLVASKFAYKARGKAVLKDTK